MKISNKFLFIIFRLTIMLLIFDNYNVLFADNSTSEYSDREIGISEIELYSKYGKPSSILWLKPTDLEKGPFRPRVKSNIPQGCKMQIIKEFKYYFDKSIQLFWLIERKPGEWRVISDYRYPKSMIF